MKRIAVLALAAVIVFVCCNCTWMSGSYASVTPHKVGYTQTEDDIFEVSNYSELRNALTALIDSGAEETLITLVDYHKEQVLYDMENAVRYACSVYPIGAYAVDKISYEYGSGGAQEAISVEVSYRHSKTEIDQIHNVRGISGAKSAIAEALRSCQNNLVLQITGYNETDFVQLIDDYSAAHPDVVMECPQVTAQTYPQQGSVRILELQFSYTTSREALRYMQKQVAPIFSSAKLYVPQDSYDAVKVSQLYSFLMQRFNYTIQSSITPAYSLLCYGVGDSAAFANVYGAMCRQIGIEAVTVSGTCNGESRFWNIVRCDNIYYHVDLLRSLHNGQFKRYTDGEMGDYVWDYSAYPPCGEVFDETSHMHKGRNPQLN